LHKELKQKEENISTVTGGLADQICQLFDGLLLDQGRVHIAHIMNFERSEEKW
jgi:hypothetical protein